MPRTLGRRDCRLASRLAAPSAAPPTSAPIAPLTIVPRLGPLDSETVRIAGARLALVAERLPVPEAPAAPRFAFVDLVGLAFALPSLLGLGFALVALLGLGFALVALLALGFALAAALLADGLARDACAPRGFDVGLVPVLLVARPVLAGAALRLLD